MASAASGERWDKTKRVRPQETLDRLILSNFMIANFKNTEIQSDNGRMRSKRKHNTADLIEAALQFLREPTDCIHPAHSIEDIFLEITEIVVPGLVWQPELETHPRSCKQSGPALAGNLLIDTIFAYYTREVQISSSTLTKSGIHVGSGISFWEQCTTGTLVHNGAVRAIELILFESHLSAILNAKEVKEVLLNIHGSCKSDFDRHITTSKKSVIKFSLL
jgi:hypothetical protein